MVGELKTTTLTCPICSKEFQTSKKNKAKYCSKECAHEAALAKRKAPRPCQRCGVIFRDARQICKRCREGGKLDNTQESFTLTIQMSNGERFDMEFGEKLLSRAEIKPEVGCLPRPYHLYFDRANRKLFNSDVLLNYSEDYYRWTSFYSAEERTEFMEFF